MEQDRPKVGVGVIVKKDGKVLLGKRKGAHGFGTWSFPGGHLEFGESLESCAARETLEETSLVVSHFEKGPFTNDIHTTEGKHYITIFMITEWQGGEPEIKEPEKCEMWQWFPWSELPQPLFLPIQTIKEEGFNPFIKN